MMLGALAIAVALTALTGTATAATLRPLVLSPETGAAGTTVTVTSYAFDYKECGGQATLYWEGYESDQHEVTLSDTETRPPLATTMTVPSDAPPGDLVLQSLCEAGERTATAVFGVMKLTLFPVEGRPGTTVEATGTGFANCGASTSLRWDGHDEEVVADIDPDTGEFHRELTVPADAPPGPLTVETACAGVRAPFTVTPGESGGGGGGGPTVSPTTTTTPTTTTRSGGAPPDTPDPGPGGNHEAAGGGGLAPVSMTSTLPVANEVLFDPEVLLVAGLLAALLILLIAFPAELFNKTYEQNKDEIHGVLARLGFRGDRFPSWLGLTLFLGLGTVLSVVLAGAEGAAGNPVAQVIGFLVAIPVVTFAYGLPAELYTRGRTRVRGFLEVLPPALLVVVLCAGVSLLLGLEPPYLYGLFAGFVALRPRPLSTRDEGGAILLGAVCLLGCAVAAFVLWGPVHAAAYGTSPTWPAVVGDAVLFWVFVLATESLVFALPPLRFLDGRKLRDWHLVWWLVPQVLAVVAFTYVFVLRGRLSPPDGGTAAVIKALVFFAVFGVLSTAVWAYFQWPGRPTASVRPWTRRSRPGAGGGSRPRHWPRY